MTASQQRRLWIVVTGLVFATVVVIGRLVAFQVVQSEEWVTYGERIQNTQVVARPDRGIIYDRNGAVLAGNSSDYRVAASPPLVTQREELATALAPILQKPRYEILAALQARRPYVVLAGRVSPQIAEAIRALPYTGIQLDALPRRIYPQNELMCHTLGYTDFDGRGGAGLEGKYQVELAGEAASAFLNISPLTQQRSVIAREGADLVLSIDRSVQFLVEQHLAQGIEEYRGVSGTIIVMQPRTGAILAMASLPCYSPFRFFETDERLLLHPAVTEQFEPGSIMKLITMAAALDSGVVTPHSTYYDAGVIELGGHRMYNWDRSGPGTTDMTTLLGRSLNVGAATIASWMGADVYYSYLDRFNFGRPTGIDLMAEGAGQMNRPGDSLWTEADIATNSFGQGLATTPLQMIAATAALANDGYMMQPYVVQELRSNGRVIQHQPQVLSRPISAETARQVTNMAITSVRQETAQAQINGYTIAGKTGTAQIAEGGYYHRTDTIAAFIGWLPADDPELIILIKLDRPKVSTWGSQTAAPMFARLVEELVVLLGIPPDNVRLRANLTANR
jgi:cell division protein FtsI (penicillin-binding protein 3)